MKHKKTKRFQGQGIQGKREATDLATLQHL